MEAGSGVGGRPRCQQPRGKRHSQSLTLGSETLPAATPSGFLLPAARAHGPPRTRPVSSPPPCCLPTHTGRPASAQWDLAQGGRPTPGPLSPALQRGGRVRSVEEQQWPKCLYHFTGRMDLLAAGFQNETRNQVSSFELDKASPSAREAGPRAGDGRPLSPEAQVLQAEEEGHWLHPPSGGVGRSISRGHRLGKPIPDVANKKSKVHETSRERLLAKPAHRCYAFWAAGCQIVAAPLARNHKRSSEDREEADLSLKSTVPKSILSFAKQEAVWASRAPSSPSDLSLLVGEPASLPDSHRRPPAPGRGRAEPRCQGRTQQPCPGPIAVLPAPCSVDLPGPSPGTPGLVW